MTGPSKKWLVCGRCPNRARMGWHTACGECVWPEQRPYPTEYRGPMEVTIVGEISILA